MPTFVHRVLYCKSRNGLSAANSLRFVAFGLNRSTLLTADAVSF